MSVSRASLKLLGSLGAPCGPVAPSPSQAYNTSHGADPLLAPVPQVLQPHIVPLPSPYPSHLIHPPSSSLLIHCSSAFPGLSCNKPRDGAPSSLPHAFLVEPGSPSLCVYPFPPWKMRCCMCEPRNTPGNTRVHWEGAGRDSPWVSACRQPSFCTVLYST